MKPVNTLSRLLVVVVFASPLLSAQEADPRPFSRGSIFDVFDHNGDGVLTPKEMSYSAEQPGFDLIIGPKGSSLQLVINTLYHMSKPIENVPYDYYLEFTQKAEGVDPKALFKRLDTNADGVISYEAEIVDDECKSLVRLLCRRADRTPNDKITRPEFERVFLREPYVRVARKFDAVALFKQLDTNGDGVLSGEWNLSEKLRDELRRLRVKSWVMHSFFQRVDRSGHGVITETEWQRALKPYPKLKLDGTALFKQLDTNSDGKLTDERVLPKKLMEAFDAPVLTKKQAGSFLKDADVAGNRDGFASKVELARLLQQEPYSYTRIGPSDILGRGGEAKNKVPATMDLPDRVRRRFEFEIVHPDDASVFFAAADQQADGSIELPELTRAINSPGKYGRRVETAIPYCLGDSFVKDGVRYPVIGTTPQLFELKDANDKPYKFTAGRNLHAKFLDPKHFFEAVIGPKVAFQAGLKVGDTVQLTHGVSGGGGEHTPGDFRVVGIFESTGTFRDYGVFVNMEGFYVLDGHSRDGKQRLYLTEKHGKTHVHAERLPLEQREVTAILLRFRDGDGFVADLSALTMRHEVNEGNVAQAVVPEREMRALLNGGGNAAFHQLAALIRNNRGKFTKKQFSKMFPGE